ncbi:iron ABC transporter permease [Kiritimatiellota bacterium B12222]|nr:iron ABC transporter permease [Kiritimatiellota bacterium B12222]
MSRLSSLTLKTWWWLLPLLGATLLLAMSTGAYPLSLQRVAQIIITWISQADISDTDSSVLFSIRMPRVLFGALAGAVLALGGVCMQALFRNPLADPGLMGLSSGSALAAALVTLLASSFPVLSHPLTLPLAAFVGGLAVTGVVYTISNRDGRLRVDSMLLMGIAMNALCGALLGLIMVMADDTQLRSITFWSFGSLGRATLPSTGLLTLSMMLPVWGIWKIRKAMNILLMGETDAMNLGVKVETLKLILVTSSCWMVALVVAQAGLIGFVGLVIPHISRLLFGSSHHQLVPSSLLLGAIFLPLVDTFCRTINAPAELPIGMMTALIGSPFFIFLLIRQRENT